MPQRIPALLKKRKAFAYVCHRSTQVVLASEEKCFPRLTESRLNAARWIEVCLGDPQLPLDV
ncbi:MAG: hypothetical protein ACREV8_14115, partial [Gammaproteobacteria bacterium]